MAFLSIPEMLKALLFCKFRVTR